jgi:hypothetical protein
LLGKEADELCEGRQLADTMVPDIEPLTDVEGVTDTGGLALIMVGDALVDGAVVGVHDTVGLGVI